MKRILVLLLLLIACPTWGASFPFFSGGAETRTYFALPGATGSVKELDAQIKSLKAGGTVTVSSVTGNLSLFNGTAFITNPSIDLRKYVGFRIILSDGSNTLDGMIKAGGTTQTYSETELITNGTWDSNTTGWTPLRGTISSVAGGQSGNCLELMSDGTAGGVYTWKSTTARSGMLLQTTLYIKSGTMGDVLERSYITTAAGNFPIDTTSGSWQQIIGYQTATTPNPKVYVGSSVTITNTKTVLADELSVRQMITPSLYGITIVNSPDGIVYNWASNTGINTTAESYTVTISNPSGYYNFLAIGDSKTLDDSWQQSLKTSLSGEMSNVIINNTDAGVSGSTVADWAGYINTVLSGVSITPTVVLLNLGANDVSALPAESTWKANYQTVIDAIHSKYPLAKIYIAKAWRRGETSDCNTLAGWIDALVSSNSSFCYSGHDERGWLEGGDDGATMTTDGIHYSVTGETTAASQWMTALGY